MSATDKQRLVQDGGDMTTSRPYWIRYIVLVLFNIPYSAAFSISYQFCYGVVAEKYGLTFDSSSNFTSNLTYCGTKIDTNQSGVQGQVSSETSNWLLYYSLASGVPAILTTVVFGSLSDFIGRKFMFLVSHCGVLMKCAILVLMVKFNLDLRWGYLGFILEGVSGSGFVLLLASFAYTADVTSVGAGRQFGVALLEGINTVAMGASSFAIGYIITATGFLVPSVICCCLLIINIFIIVIFLPETVDKSTGSTELMLKGLKNMVRLFSQNTADKRRGRLVILMLTFLVILHSLLGTSGVSMIYQLSEPYCFSSSEIGIYGALSSLVTNFIGIPLIKIYQKFISAPIIAIVGILSDTSANLMTAFAVNKLMMYFVSVFDILTVAVSPMIRATMSNMVDGKEQGALFGSIAAVEATSYFTGSSLSNAIYSHTVEDYRGLVYICFCIFDVISILLLIFYHLRYGRQEKIHVRVIQ